MTLIDLSMFIIVCSVHTISINRHKQYLKYQTFIIDLLDNKVHYTLLGCLDDFLEESLTFESTAELSLSDFAGGLAPVSSL